MDKGDQAGVDEGRVVHGTGGSRVSGSELKVKCYWRRVGLERFEGW